jgi:alpha-mannosidase
LAFRGPSSAEPNPYSVRSDTHSTLLPRAGSYEGAESENVVVSTLKQAENGNDLIVRCFETAGMDGRASLRLPAWDRVIEADFSPYEFKTFRVPRDGARPVTEANLIEWE